MFHVLPALCLYVGMSANSYNNLKAPFINLSSERWRAPSAPALRLSGVAFPPLSNLAERSSTGVLGTILILQPTDLNSKSKVRLDEDKGDVTQ